LGAAAVVYVACIAVAARLARHLARNVAEEDIIALQDKALGLDKKPSKDWYFFP
jgi:hypothetical protein